MKNIFYIIMAAILLANCSTERIEPKNDLSKFEQTEDFLEVNKAEEQVFEITEEGDGPIIGQKGSKIYISKDLLMYPNEDSVHYPYTIKLVELYSAKDMIYYQMPSVGDDTLLTTHGEIRVRAFKDDTELVLRPEKYWVLEVPNNSPAEEMFCYYGTNADAHVNWANTHNTTFDVINDGYSGKIEEMGWVSCAKNSIQEQSSIRYTFTSDSLDLNSIATFIYLPQIEGLMQVNAATSSPLPLEEKMKIVSIGKQGEILHSFYRQDTVGIENTIEIVLSTTNDSELENLLNNF